MNSHQNKNRKPLIILLLLFALPLLSAKIVLSMNWYHGGSTNQGELLDPNLNYQVFAMDNPQPNSWQIIYLLPEHCGEPCQNRLYILHQSHLALGGERNRVIPIVLLQTNSDLDALKPFTFQTATISSLLNNLMAQQQLIIVDPLGDLIIRYQQVENKQEQLLQGKALVADLRKMLKLSRIG